MNTVLLPVEKILNIHTDLAERYGLPAYGTNPDVRDLASLNRVVDRVAALSKDAGPRRMSVLAGEYLFDLIVEHPFVDANRRTAAACALYFLEINGVDALIDDRLLEEVLGAVSAGRMNRSSVHEFLSRFVHH